MRLWGAVLIVAGAALLGMCAVRQLKQREKNLQELIAGLEIVQRELSNRLTPIPELLMQASEQTAGEIAVFFRCCAEEIKCMDGKTFWTIWKKNLNSLHLERTDRETLERLGGVLGRYDDEVQCQSIEKAIKRLEGLRQQAAVRSVQLGKVYTVLSLAGGALLVIFFI